MFLLEILVKKEYCLQEHIKIDLSMCIVIDENNENIDERNISLFQKLCELNVIELYNNSLKMKQGNIDFLT